MNADRATNALLAILDISARQYTSVITLADKLKEGLRAGAAARKTIADRCQTTAGIIADKM